MKMRRNKACEPTRGMKEKIIDWGKRFPND